MDDLFDIALEEGIRHLTVFADKPSGLKALCVIDDVRLGPAAGGIRTQPYPSVQHAMADAAKLARAMTKKCALAGLRAGGGKIVVIEHARLDRERAFAVLGRRIGDLGGQFRAGPDLGTRSSDLLAAGAETEFVHANIARVSTAVARSVLAGIEACVRVKGDKALGELTVAVQGCGAVGAAVSRALARAGARVIVADTDQNRARVVQEETGAAVVDPSAILSVDADVFAPCAMGGVLTAPKVEGLQAWAVCGGANNVLASPAVGAALQNKGVLFVPDVISSAGGVAEGVGRDVMHLDETEELLAHLGQLAEEVLREAAERGVPPDEIAEERARARLEGH